MKHVTIKDVTFYHGQSVIAGLPNSDDDSDEEIIIEDCKISINDDQIGKKDQIEFFICQNQKDGSNANDKLGYDFSWHVKVKDGEIVSSDTNWIKEANSEAFNFDNDIMPNDWVMDETIPDNL